MYLYRLEMGATGSPLNYLFVVGSEITVYVFVFLMFFIWI